MGKSNADTFLDADPGTTIVDNIPVQEEFIQGTYWFGTTYRLLYKPRIQLKLPSGTNITAGGFDPEKILNVGPRAKQWDAEKSKWSVKAITHDGWNDGRPSFLDADGKEIAIDPDTGQLAQDPVFLNMTFHRASISGHWT